MFTNPKKQQNGFTLIELIIVIVILGILAVTAAPKFIDLGTDARVAVLNALKAEITSFAKISHAKCLIDNGCNKNVNFQGTPSPSTEINGQEIGYHFGYPKAFPHNGLPDITALLDLSGFTVQHYVGSSFNRVFTMDKAPTPENCSVTYQ